MCKRECVVDGSVHGLEYLTVGVLRFAVANGFVPHSDWVRDVAFTVSAGKTPDNVPTVEFHDQGEVIDKAVEYLSVQAFDDQGTGEGCEAPDYYTIDDNSLYFIECDDPINCEDYTG